MFLVLSQICSWFPHLSLIHNLPIPSYCSSLVLDLLFQILNLIFEVFSYLRHKSTCRFFIWNQLSRAHRLLHHWILFKLLSSLRRNIHLSMNKHVLRIILLLFKFKINLQLAVLLWLTLKLLFQSINVFLKPLDRPPLYFHLALLLLKDLQQLLLVEDLSFWIVFEVFDALQRVEVLRGLVLYWHGAELIEGGVACGWSEGVVDVLYLLLGCVVPVSSLWDSFSFACQHGHAGSPILHVGSGISLTCGGAFGASVNAAVVFTKNMSCIAMSQSCLVWDVEPKTSLMLKLNKIRHTSLGRVFVLGLVILAEVNSLEPGAVFVWLYSLMSFIYNPVICLFHDIFQQFCLRVFSFLNLFILLVDWLIQHHLMLFLIYCRGHRHHVLLQLLVSAWGHFVINQVGVRQLAQALHTIISISHWLIFLAGFVWLIIRLGPCLVSARMLVMTGIRRYLTMEFIRILHKGLRQAGEHSVQVLKGSVAYRGVGVFDDQGISSYDLIC